MLNLIGTTTIQLSVNIILLIVILLIIISLIVLYRYDKKAFFEILTYIICLFVCLGIFILIIFSNLDSIYNFITGSN